MILASTSPQRRAILEQLRIPYEAVPPAYVEHDPPDADPVLLVREHAVGKARSVHREGDVTLGVDTTVRIRATTLGKAADRADAERMLRALSGATHDVVSGICLLGPGFEELHHVVTGVTFRHLSDDDIATYLDSDEWQGRAGAYAIQGLGSRLVERIDGDYLNVVGLPGARLVELLSLHSPGLLTQRS